MSRAMLARKSEAAPVQVAKRSLPALRVGDPADAFEREADRAAATVVSGGGVGPIWSLSRMNIAPPPQREHPHGGNEAPAIVHDVLHARGQPIEAATRAFMERRFGHDFSRVRVHADAKAAESTRAVDALAYTVGSDVVLDPSRVRPNSTEGRRLLAHELAHVVQQHGHDAAAVNPAAAQSRATARPSLMRLTADQFRNQLGATPDEKTAINALFADAQFKGLFDYLAACKAAPKQDLGPLALKVTPGLKIGGVERFGGYSPMARTLEINPTKAEHTANPQELVDTIVHELIHAVDDLNTSCVKAGSPQSPLAATGAGTASSLPKLADVKGTPDEDKLLKEVGPGASNPCEEFIDINKQAQQIVVSVIQSNIKTTKIGRPTLIFVNDTLRKNPAALAEYKTCRDAACAKADPNDRKAAIAQCSQQIITKYVTPPAAAASPQQGASPSPPQAGPQVPQ